MNTKHNADLVIEASDLGNGYIVWKDDQHLVICGRAAMRLIVAGAIAQKLSVYDAEAGWFLSGTLDQMDVAP
jgi:hypothetical protein